MNDPYLEELLSRLNKAIGPTPAGAKPDQPRTVDERADSLLDSAEQGLRSLGTDPPREHAVNPPVERAKPPIAPAQTSASSPTLSASLVPGLAASNAEPEFIPPAPTTLAQARLSEGEVESLVLKFLLNQGSATGREIAEQLKLPFGLVNDQLFQLKAERLVVHKGAAVADYVYQLTADGLEMARRYFRHCSYFGAAPVHLDDYVASVRAQSVAKQRPTVDQLDAIFNDLLVNDAIRNQIGQAIHAGHGFFLYGAPGNGKTSLAERVARAYGQTIWIPRALGIDGEIIRLYDPYNHVAIPPVGTGDNSELQGIDQRWVRIRRPTVVVGGELTMERLEVTLNTQTGINEAPVQLKSNCGTLVIDDFGRQRVSIEELLNRWIVPLDRRFDFLTLRSGKTIQVPFDQLLIFSTNLEPRDLVDEAFLRRIPYKIEVFDPTPDEFRRLLEMYAGLLGVEHRPDAVEYLIRKHYVEASRSFRFCHARDLLLQVRNYCLFNKRPALLSEEAVDVAVHNYFAIMGERAGGVKA